MLGVLEWPGPFWAGSKRPPVSQVEGREGGRAAVICLWVQLIQGGVGRFFSRRNSGLKSLDW